MELIGKSPAMKKVTELIEMVAPTEATVLITGESGTGKEVVARAIHAAGPRRYMPMVTIHCGALTETLLESELFGHEKGAFTGAQYRKKGKFEVADGGTVFLDEISDISLKTQTDLLRVLQEKEIVRVGGNQQIKVDFRAIAATNKNLETLVKAGTFRPDLYYRLHVFCIELPPLRERREDIPLLVDHFLNKFCLATSRPVPAIAPEAIDVLMRHDWPGNVRELENAVERALVVGRGNRRSGRPISPSSSRGTSPRAARRWTTWSGSTSSASCARRSTTSPARRGSWTSIAPRCTTSCAATGCGETDPPHPAGGRPGPSVGAPGGRAGAHVPHAVPHPAARRWTSPSRAMNGRGQHYSTAILQRLERVADSGRARARRHRRATSTSRCSRSSSARRSSKETARLSRRPGCTTSSTACRRARMSCASACSKRRRTSWVTPSACAIAPTGAASCRRATASSSWTSRRAEFCRSCRKPILGRQLLVTGLLHPQLEVDHQHQGVRADADLRRLEPAKLSLAAVLQQLPRLHLQRVPEVARQTARQGGANAADVHSRLAVARHRDVLQAQLPVAVRRTGSDHDAEVVAETDALPEHVPGRAPGESGANPQAAVVTLDVRRFQVGEIAARRAIALHVTTPFLGKELFAKYALQRAELNVQFDRIGAGDG